MNPEQIEKNKNLIFNFLLRLADDRLILGHRLSEWCGHAPILEEDIAITNIALDCIGQANAFYTVAADLEQNGRSADDLAFLRNERDFTNLQLLEQPNGDFAFTIARQFYYDNYSLLLLSKLSESNFTPLQGLAEKSLKEITYHCRHSRQWILKLGDGTEESKARIQNAINELWMFTGELFYDDSLTNKLAELNVSPLLISLKNDWLNNISETLNEATLSIPENNNFIKGSREGLHTEHLGHILAEMQILPRSIPNAEW